MANTHFGKMFRENFPVGLYQLIFHFVEYYTGPQFRTFLILSNSPSSRQGGQCPRVTESSFEQGRCHGLSRCLSAVSADRTRLKVTEKGLSTVGPHGPHLRIPSFLISRHLLIPLGVPPCLRRVRQDHFGTAFTSIFSISRNALQLGGRLLKDFKVSNVTTDCLLLLDFFSPKTF